ncbi:transmembrane protein 80 [Ranitomeya variabilis]|uniref:transmembrane protein 80 n=1 Tax=Ranitomeya variabilis TaxID=490064 RepID=UPI00405788DC
MFMYSYVWRRKPRVSEGLRRNMAVTARERSSHNCLLVLLQILLYINVLYYVFYFLATLIMIIYKSQVYSYPDSNLALDLGLLFLMAILESLRLYMGSMGNLKEEALPLLSSLFFTAGNITLSVYFLIWQTYILVADVTINAILLVFYGLEAILQLFAIATFFR